VIRFGPVEESVIVDRLVGQGAERTEALFWARFSQGSLGVAQAWAGDGYRRTDGLSGQRELVDRLANLKAGEVLERPSGLSRSPGDRRGLGEGGRECQQERPAAEGPQGSAADDHRVCEDAMTSAVSPGRAMIHADQAGAIERIQQGETPVAGRRVEAGYEKLRWIESHVNERD
jgi:hypothetical protein